LPGLFWWLSRLAKLGELIQDPIEVGPLQHGTSKSQRQSHRALPPHKELDVAHLLTEPMMKKCCDVVEPKVLDLSLLPKPSLTVRLSTNLEVVSKQAAL
jgi:hypothetical protein